MEWFNIGDVIERTFNPLIGRGQRLLEANFERTSNRRHDGVA